MAENQKPTKTPSGLPCGITEAQLKQWKKEFGENSIKLISIPVDGQTISGVFRKPDKTVMSAALTVGGQDALKIGEIIYDNCKLVVDPEMDAVDEIKVSAFLKLTQEFKIYQAEVKNL